MIWADQSGNGASMSRSPDASGDRPAFNTATLNGSELFLTFDGSGQFLSNTDGTDDFLTGEDDFYDSLL